MLQSLVSLGILISVRLSKLHFLAQVTGFFGLFFHRRNFDRGFVGGLSRKVHIVVLNHCQVLFSIDDQLD